MAIIFALVSVVASIGVGVTSVTSENRVASERGISNQLLASAGEITSDSHVAAAGEGVSTPPDSSAAPGSSTQPDRGSQAVSSSSRAGSSSASLFEELKTFADVLSIVQEDYVRPIDNRKVVEGAIRGLLTTLDPHSGYLDPDFYRDLQSQTKGEFGGLGIEINVRDGVLVVVAPMEGSPAAAAGIRAGDAIVKINGRFTKDMPLVEAVKRLRGEKGTAVKLSVARRGVAALLDFELVRDIIQVKSVKSRLLEPGIGYVRITQFAEKTSEDLRSALKLLRTRSPDGELRGLVMDLRNNPGGLLNQAVEVADLFLDEGVIVYTDGRDPNQRHNFYAHARGTEPTYPIVVLINGGSASAAEIVSGAFQDAARAVVVGTQSFGKGSVQTIMPLANGGAVTLTTALYYTKSGRSIQVTGVRPDVIVEALDFESAANLESKSGEAQSDTVAPGSAGRKIGEPLLKEGDLPGAIENPGSEHAIPEDSNEQKPVLPGAEQPVLPQSPDAMKRINRIDVENFKPIEIETVALEDWIKRDPQFAKAVEILKRDVPAVN